MAETSKRRRVWAEAAALLLLSAGIRLGYVWAVPRMLDSADAIHYLETARTFSQGDFLAVDPKIPALYPALTAIVGLVCSNIETAGQVVSFIFSVLLVLPVYFLSRHLHDGRVAPIAGLLVAMWPWLIDYGNRVATEPTAVFFWMLGALCMVRGLDPKGSTAWMIGAALSFGALHLARAEGTFVLLAAAGAGAIAGWHGEWRPVLRKLAVYVAVASVLLVLHAFYMHALVGQWTVNYRVGFIGEQPEGSTVFAEFGKTLVAMSADVPAVMLGPLLWALFGVGMAWPRTRSTGSVRAEGMLLYFAAVQWLIVLPVLSPAPRYLMAAFVALSLWSARGIMSCSDAIGNLTPRVWLRLAPLGIVLVWMALHLGAAVATERWDRGGLPAQPWEYKITGEWMRDNLESGPIVTRKPQVGYYAEMPTIGVETDATLDEIIAHAGAVGARYLIVDERYTTALVPALAPLLDATAVPESLRVLRADLSPYPDGRIVVYEFIRGR